MELFYKIFNIVLYLYVDIQLINCLVFLDDVWYIKEVKKFIDVLRFVLVIKYKISKLK